MACGEVHRSAWQSSSGALAEEPHFPGCLLLLQVSITENWELELPTVYTHTNPPFWFAPSLQSRVPTTPTCARAAYRGEAGGLTGSRGAGPSELPWSVGCPARHRTLHPIPQSHGPPRPLPPHRHRIAGCGPCSISPAGWHWAAGAGWQDGCAATVPMTLHPPGRGQQHSRFRHQH